MKKEDYIKCIISVMNFLVLSDDEVNEEKRFDTESNNMMMKTLGKYGYDMISFTEHLSGENLWENSPKEFFMDDERCLFFSYLNLINSQNKLMIEAQFGIK
jgi:hypothetical protein